MDRFGLTHVATWRPTIIDGGAGDGEAQVDGADVDGMPVAHRYGRLELRIDRPGVSVPTVETLPADLTDTERLGLRAAQRRESAEYRTLKADRARAGEAWNFKCTDGGEPTRSIAAGRRSSPRNGALQGPVAIGLVLVQNSAPGGQLTDVELVELVADAQEAMSFYIARNVFAAISASWRIDVVTLDLPEDPSLAAADREPYWRDPALMALGYSAGGDGIDDYGWDLRDAANAPSGFIIFVTKYPVKHYAYVPAINGSYMVIGYDDLWWGPGSTDAKIAHEAGHIFGCPDEYQAGTTCTQDWTSAQGDIHNANCENVAADGGVPCIMKSNTLTVCNYTPAHLGWTPGLALRAFAEEAAAGSWHGDRHLRLAADLTADGRDDLVGFGDAGVFTARAIGAGRFEAPRFVLGEFGYENGWRVGRHPRFVADVTATGTRGIIGFGDDGVWYAAGNGDATFAPPTLVVGDFGYHQGWRTTEHVRLLADVTGDGKADIVAFGHHGVWTAIADGAGFEGPVLAVQDFGTVSGWTPARHVRTAADVTGDSRADIVGFGDAGVYVAVAVDGGFAAPVLAVADFGYDQGWRVERHLRMVVQLGLLRASSDLVGFGEDGVWIARSAGDGTFAPPTLVLEDFGAAQGWTVEKHPRVFADTTGDGRWDIVGFGPEGVRISRQLADGVFDKSFLANRSFSASQGWTIQRHPRLCADIDGDGRFDIVGFASNGVQVVRL